MRSAYWSGTPVTEICKKYDISESTAYYWIAPSQFKEYAAERAIRPFTIGRKNWVMCDTIHGAEDSAIIYSITETAKANDLKPYEYIKHLLTEIPKHMEDTDLEFLEDLLPWSDKLPAECRKQHQDRA